jgi:hypothetical protein
MNTKLIIAATVAAFSLATTAFAGEGAGDPFPFRAPTSPVTVTASRDVGSNQYPAFNPALSSTSLAQQTLPENGQNGPVETANSLPKGFMDGTVAYMEAQRTDRWFAQQAERRFAQSQARRLRPNG